MILHFQRMRQIFCIVCDALNFKKGLLCKFCDDKVSLRAAPYSLRLEGDVKHYYLFEWTKESDHFCRRLAYFLKNRPQLDFKEWSFYLPSHLKSVRPRIAVVPAASSRAKFNHAQEFAKSLEKLLSLSCVLEIEGGFTPQKCKTRGERLTEWSLPRNSGIKLDENWVFIDDVFVTGGTYNRVRAEVGTTPEIILTLFYKPLMERDENDL